MALLTVVLRPNTTAITSPHTRTHTCCIKWGYLFPRPWNGNRGSWCLDTSHISQRPWETAPLPLAENAFHQSMFQSMRDVLRFLMTFGMRGGLCCLIVWALLTSVRTITKRRIRHEAQWKEIYLSGPEFPSKFALVVLMMNQDFDGDLKIKVIRFIFLTNYSNIKQHTTIVIFPLNH